jgi:hypothetical protein
MGEFEFQIGESRVTRLQERSRNLDMTATNLKIIGEMSDKMLEWS